MINSRSLRSSKHTEINTYSSISSWVGEEVGFGGLDVLRHGLLRLCNLIGGVLDPGEELVGGDHLNDAATVA